MIVIIIESTGNSFYKQLAILLYNPIEKRYLLQFKVSGKLLPAT